MRISDWSSDVCSSDLLDALRAQRRDEARVGRAAAGTFFRLPAGELRQHLARRGAQPALGREERLTAAVPRHAEVQVVARAAERRVGTECVSTCRSRWSTDNSNKNSYKIHKLD